LANVQENGILPVIGKREAISAADLQALIDQLMNLVNQTADLINQGLFVCLNSINLNQYFQNVLFLNFDYFA
jgi:hypothetical protein